MNYYLVHAISFPGSCTSFQVSESISFQTPANQKGKVVPPKEILFGVRPI